MHHANIKIVFKTLIWPFVVDQIPYIESGTYVAYNDENGGVIQCLKEDGIVDLDTDFSSLPEWISMKAMVSTWLADAIMHELWVGSDGTSARTIYQSGRPWLIGRALFMKQVYVVKQRLGITKENAERREAEVTLLSFTIFFCNLLISNLRTCTSVRKHTPVEWFYPFIYCFIFC